MFGNNRDSLHKSGTLVGEDKYGNKYYENNRYFYIRDRWVDFNRKVCFDHDATMIPPEWHRWIHHTTDLPPNKHPPVHYDWMLDHTQNFTGTDKSYVPYSTYV